MARLKTSSEVKNPTPNAAPTRKEEPAGLPVPNSSKSFWHSEPSSFLLGHRSTSDLPSEADIVIVGSGITGASAARFLHERGYKGKIVLLEAREVCWGATGRNGGHCQPLLFDRGVEVAKWELRNVDAVKSYITENNIPCEWRSVSGCRTFWSPALIDAAETEVNKLKKEAPEIGKMVQIIRDKEELKKHRVDPSCSGATLTQGAGQLWPYKYICHIIETLTKSSYINLQTNTPVHKIESLNTNDSGGYRQSITTDRGVIKTKSLILATNGYTSHLLPEFSDLVVPCRGEMSAQLPPKDSTRLPNSYGFVGSHGQNPNHDDYLIQRPFEGVPNPAGHLMFGGGRGSASNPQIGEWDDGIVDEGSAEYLRKALLGCLELGGKTEGVGELKPTHQWTGIMGFSRDDTPWVGEVPGRKGTFLCAGYTGHGMPNGTLCGKAVVEMVSKEMSEGATGEVLREWVLGNGDLPRGYEISEERIEKARGMVSVEVADREGILGDQSEEFYELGKKDESDGSRL